MNTSTHYGLNLVEGTDLVNPLIQDVPNYETIDAQMFSNECATVGTATELVTGTVHALTRANSDIAVFRFTATSNYNAGETFVVDGIQVTALTPSGETLTTGAYIIGAEVLCALRDTLLTMYVTGTSIADNSLALEGHPASYFGTAEDVATAVSVSQSANIISQANQKAITELNSDLDEVKNNVKVGIDSSNLLHSMGQGVLDFTPTEDCFCCIYNASNNSISIDGVTVFTGLSGGGNNWLFSCPIKKGSRVQSWVQYSASFYGLK